MHLSIRPTALGGLARRCHGASEWPAEPGTLAAPPVNCVLVEYLATNRTDGRCRRRLNTHVHHEPSDVPGVDYGTGGVGRTVVALKRLGITVDEPMWLNANTACSTYCSGDSCSGGGGSGDPGCKHTTKCSSHCRNTFGCRGDILCSRMVL